jgi:hypothetical protein
VKTVNVEEHWNAHRFVRFVFFAGGTASSILGPHDGFIVYRAQHSETFPGWPVRHAQALDHE